MFWAFSHGMPLWGTGFLLAILLSWVPFLGVAVALAAFAARIYLGINGHKLGWQNRRFEGGVPQFLEVETKWRNWAVGIIVVYIILIPLLAAILYPVFAKAREKAREAAAHGVAVPVSPTSR